jgi:hypothetical protein
MPEKLDPEAKRLRKVSPAYLADQIGALEARIEVFKAEAIRRELRRAEGEAYRIVLTPPGTSQRTDKPLLLKVLGITGIVAGHARLKAAQKIGLTEVPTIELSWLTPAEKQAYIIADNQTAIAGSGWDAEMLRLVPTIELSWLTPAEKQAYIIADNQTAIAGSGWDAEMLRLELGRPEGTRLRPHSHRLRRGAARHVPRGQDRGADRPGRRAGGSRASCDAAGRSVAVGCESHVPALPQGHAARAGVP